MGFDPFCGVLVSFREQKKKKKDKKKRDIWERQKSGKYPLVVLQGVRRKGVLAPGWAVRPSPTVPGGVQVPLLPMLRLHTWLGGRDGSARETRSCGGSRGKGKRRGKDWIS